MTRWRDVLHGLITAFDLFPSARFPSEKTEAEAIADSWQAVGDTMKKVIADLDREVAAFDPKKMDRDA